MINVNFIDITNVSNPTLDNVKVLCNKEEWDEVLHLQGNAGLVQKECEC